MNFTPPMHFINRWTWKSLQRYILTSVIVPPVRVTFTNITCMLVFHQSNCASALKHMLFYYCHISTFMYFRVFVCSLLLRRVFKSTTLRVGVKTSYHKSS